VYNFKLLSILNYYFEITILFFTINITIFT